MKMSKKHTLWALLALTAWVAAGSGQQPNVPEQGTPLVIEGEITSLSMTAPGPPSLTVKNAEGVEYVVHFGPLPMLRNQGFNPKVGDRITVSGSFCCEVENKQVIHSSEMTLGEKTYRTPMTPEQRPRMGPGMRPGPNMPRGAGECPNAGNCPNGPHPEHEGMHHEMHHGMHR